ncbi:MAG: Uma2 family endonuclease [Desulfurellaceae bacterium]|nr:Uma2 family endonuclease [Desulfurellaceae bacterium]
MPEAIAVQPATPLRLNLRPVMELTDERLYLLCQANQELRFERTAQGELLLMAPTAGETGRRNAKLTQHLANWADTDGSGLVFDSSTGFVLPNGAMRSPDAAWLRRSRWESLSPDQKQTFLPLCPDFVIELRSGTDSLQSLQDKLQEYIQNGALLGWLIDPQYRRVYVYRPGAPSECLEKVNSISGDPELPGFGLDLSQVWG